MTDSIDRRRLRPSISPSPSSEAPSLMMTNEDLVVVPHPDPEDLGRPEDEGVTPSRVDLGFGNLPATFHRLAPLLEIQMIFHSMPVA